MAEFGDIVLSHRLDKPAEINGFELIAALARRYDVQVSDLLALLAGSDLLARMCRDALGLQELYKPAKKGRPVGPEAWELFAFAVNAIHETPDINYNQIARRWVAKRDSDNPRFTPDDLKGRVNTVRHRIDRFGSLLSRTSPLSILFLDGLPSK